MYTVQCPPQGVCQNYFWKKQNKPRLYDLSALVEVKQSLEQLSDDYLVISPVFLEQRK